jgi:FkbM family methyltransferase
MYKTSPTCQIPKLPEIYQLVFGNNYIGSFVEVGAYDGLTYSNTYGLAEMGWRGLYIEPVYSAYRQCVFNHERHPNIKVLNACVGDGNPVMLYEAGEASTTSSDFALLSQHIWNTEYKHTQVVNTETLDTIMMDEGWDDWESEEFSLLVIDVEGANESILNNYSIKIWRPTMVIIEVHEQNVHRELQEHAIFANDYFNKAGYDKIYADNCNNIYVRRR